MKIKTIILDLGNVILQVEIERTQRKLIEMGLDQEELEKLNFNMFEYDIYNRLETNDISESEFRDHIRSNLSASLSDEEVDEPWNIMNHEVPEENVKLIEELKNRYSVFLLSNSNSIHYKDYNARFIHKYRYNSINELFDQAYFSFELGLRKPDPKIYQYVLEENNLIPSETLFVDDRIENILSARSLGIQCIHLIDFDLIQALIDY